MGERLGETDERRSWRRLATHSLQHGPRVLLGNAAKLHELGHVDGRVVVQAPELREKEGVAFEFR